MSSPSSSPPPSSSIQSSSNHTPQTQSSSRKSSSSIPSFITPPSTTISGTPRPTPPQYRVNPAADSINRANAIKKILQQVETDQAATQTNIKITEQNIIRHIDNAIQANYTKLVEAVNQIVHPPKRPAGVTNDYRNADDLSARLRSQHKRINNKIGPIGPVREPTDDYRNTSNLSSKIRSQHRRIKTQVGPVRELSHDIRRRNKAFTALLKNKKKKLKTVTKRSNKSSSNSSLSLPTGPHTPASLPKMSPDTSVDPNSSTFYPSNKSPTPTPTPAKCGKGKRCPRGSSCKKGICVSKTMKKVK